MLGACFIAFCLGAVFERAMLTPMYTGKVDRPVEYGILATFGLAFTLAVFRAGGAWRQPGQGAAATSTFRASVGPKTPIRIGSRPAGAT